MAFRLDGRRALVLGGTRGIGLGIAKAFVEAGARVALTGRKADDAGDAAAVDLAALVGGNEAHACWLADDASSWHDALTSQMLD